MVKNNRKIAILMATYNGERYLREQIESLRQQTFEDWCLYVHDDCSKDSTADILREYADRYPEKVVVLEYPAQGGACKNFLSLLAEVESEYYMFCDQDDIWLDTKIETEWQAMQAVEEAGKPVLIATDLKVVDGSLNELQPSLWAIAGIHPEYISTFDEIAANSMVTGCTLLMNHRLREVALPASPRATMHDAWLACCVLKYGGILKCLPEKTILYRQHQGNVFGAQDVTKKTLGYRLRHISESWRLQKEHYLMLKDLSYGSILKFIRYRWQYRKRIKQGQ